MAKKSASQIRRMQKRALKRGEEYVAPPEKEVHNHNTSHHEQTKYDAAQTLKEALDELEENSTNLNSKERRSAKRKAEAIALEEVNKNDNDNDDTDKRISSVDELLQWYEENKHKFQKNQKKNDTSDDRISKEDRIKFDAVRKYQTTIKNLEQNREELNSKDRRSAKRKAEAIACEESAMDDIEKLLIWYEQNKEMLKSMHTKSSKKRKANDDGNGDGDGDGDGEETSKKSKISNPYILFIGQIPYDTTKEELLQHFQKYMGKELIQEDTITIRIPNDEKAKGKKVKKVTPNPDGEDFVSYVSKNKGFAFCEFQDPEVMYECLKLHHTPLDGRRINVLRSAGGGKAARTETHKQRKKEQDEYISVVVDKIIEEHVNNGTLKEGELDEGALLLCKRRSAAVVEMALSHYIEQKEEKERESERPLDNPSAFFSSIICRVTDEGGLFESKKKKDKGSNGGSYKNQTKKSSQDNKFRARDSSVFTQSGVDMSISEKSGKDGDNKMSQLFPSSRGRGRGRGAYMR